MKRTSQIAGVMPIALLALAAAAAAVVGTATASDISYDRTTQLSADLSCTDGYFEAGSPLYDGTVAPDPLTPIERVQEMIIGGFLTVQGSPVIIDDSRLDSEGGTVVVGTNSAGTLGIVEFANDATYGWLIKGIRSCV